MGDDAAPPPPRDAHLVSNYVFTRRAAPSAPPSPNQAPRPRDLIAGVNAWHAKLAVGPPLHKAPRTLLRAVSHGMCDSGVVKHVYVGLEDSEHFGFHVGRFPDDPWSYHESAQMAAAPTPS